MHNIINKLVNIIFGICMVIVLWFVAQVFVFALFKVPTDSMEPELIPGDNLLVMKPIIGARIFNLFASFRKEPTNIYRIPGYREIKRNDVLVFNFPYPNNWNKIEMNIFKYYVKRCIGLPGDSILIRNGLFHIEGVQMPVGNILSQKEIARTSKFSEGIFHSYPFDSIIGWNIKEFGPLYIPAKGDSILMNRTNFKLYERLIEWEQQEDLECKDCTIYLNENQIKSYCFKKNYYFVAGDNSMNSQDSRYWGLLPEDHIVGKVSYIWRSKDINTNEYRFNRFFKSVD